MASIKLRDVERQTSTMWKKVADQVKKNQTTMKKQIVNKVKPVEGTWARLREFFCGKRRS